MLVDDERVGIVIYDDDIMLLGETDELDVCLHHGIAACRHVRVIRPHQSHSVEIHFLKLFPVWLPTFVLTQVIIDYLLSENL